MIEGLSRSNRVRYRLMGEPKYCHECGQELRLMKYGDKYDPKTGEMLTLTIALGCSCYGHGHTHIHFIENVSRQEDT